MCSIPQRDAQKEVPHLGFSRVTILPEVVVPTPMLLTGDFTIPCRSVEALVTKMFLKHSQTVAGVVVFDCVDGEGVPKLVR